MIYQEIKDKKGSSNQPSQIRENNAHPMNRSNVMNHFVKPIVYNMYSNSDSESEEETLSLESELMEWKSSPKLQFSHLCTIYI